MSLYKQDVIPTIPSMLLSSEDATEQVLEECENIWKQMEELTLLMKRMKTLSAEYNQWQKRTPEIISSNPDVLVALGREQLQRLDHDLEMVLSTVHAKNKQLKQDLQREQQWLEEQQQLIDCLNQTEEEISNRVIHFSEKRAFQELKSKMLKIKAYKEEILNALGEFLEEHFPLPADDGTAKKKTRSSEKAGVPLITLHEILESLIHKLIKTPHDPYVTVNDSFWSPYVELLLRYGIALRHPEDPKRIRLENFHQ
ncbi:hypothetical protein lerEdw1_000450 [Lerista edwardsae]|nr:hypothetical protein lerEdw1_000450 [Lerista edwardsae]